MITVALIGPDGAGKTTIGQMLPQLITVPIKYVYMGINLESSNHMLPTTRLIRAIKRARGDELDNRGPRDPKTIAVKRSKNPVKRALATVKSAISLVNRVSEEWFRQILTWRYQRAGNIVIFDRHYYADYYAYDVANPGQEKPWNRRLHGFMLAKVYPKPDLTIYLDAPAEVLFARKGEGTIETLESRRQSYLGMGAVLRNFEVVDVNRPVDEVARDVAALITTFYRRKAGAAGRLGDARQS
jgi:thymidylate kinase